MSTIPGIALIIPGDFSAAGKNIGQVTFQQNVAITGLSINANASYSGQSFTPTITYTPLTTNQKGVTWSIIAGSTYATINANSGVVTILSTANASNITIQAVSNSDSSIVATATTSVTYLEQVIDVTSITIAGSDSLSMNGSYVATILPSNATAKTVVWTVTNGSSLVTVTPAGNTLNIVAKGTGSVTISAVAGGITQTKTISVTNQISDSTIISFQDPVVKAICVANWDSNGDGEVTYEDLKAVTLINKAFYGNTQIQYFNEFKYFTGLINSSYVEYFSMFTNCTSLKEVTMPAATNLTSLGSSWFQGCTNLQKVIFEDNGGLTTWDGGIFGDCNSLQKVICPNTLTTVNMLFPQGAASPYTNVPDVILKENVTTVNRISESNVKMNLIFTGTTVPTTFNDTNYNYIQNIYVPDSALNNFKYNTKFTGCNVLPLSQYTGSLTN